MSLKGSTGCGTELGGTILSPSWNMSHSTKPDSVVNIYGRKLDERIRSHSRRYKKQEGEM
ncbi:hypothetical protein CDL15_Pgr016527 [Punica granatum]|uniref:Uncharacterized protein n=1 Tax=Punica granatum TaxID=22663 RepID=A0A218WJB3_PUNGR|nr:hypothetical protein CDL15_Pgr016527 [Punica granatum]